MHPEILVTGAGGLLGRALRQILPDAVYVASRDYDLCDPRQAQRMFEDHKPRKVIHLAARVGGVKINAEKNADFFTDNLLMNTHVLSAAQKNNVTHLISMLPACAFPSFEERPSAEDDLHSGLPYPGNLGYSFAKRMLDIQSRLLWEQYGSRYTTLACVTMYGPHDNWDPEEGHVLGALVHKCFLAKQHQKSLDVWGRGDAVRQFVYAPDVAKILVRYLDTIKEPGTLIVAPDSGIRISELAKAVAHAMDFDGPIHFDAAKLEGQKVRTLKSAKFSKYFSEFSFTSLEQGLKETTEWFIENYRETVSHDH